jgi:hypothetical protein
MKKTILYLSAIGFMFTACQKEDATGPETPSGSKSGIIANVSPVPASFVKKVLVEEFTSQTNGDVPATDRYFDILALNNSGRVYTAALYNGGALSHPETLRLLSTLTPGTASIPCGSIDRTPINGSVFHAPAQLQPLVNGMLNKPTNAGLAMVSSVNGRRANVDVHVGFSATLTSSYSVHAYLIEDVVTTGTIYSQANNFNSTPGNQFYQMGNPIINYLHRNVMRKMITPANGHSINPANLVTGGTEIFSLQVDLMEKSTSNSQFKVLCFITDDLSGEVLNVQMGTLGTLKDWN